MKDFICKHIIVVAVGKNLHELDKKAEQVPIGHNRKRGRPKNTAAALVIQPDESGPELSNTTKRRRV